MTRSAKGGDGGAGAREAESGAGTCGVLGQIDDERIQLMGLIVRTHRRLTDSLGRELEQSVGIPLVFFDVLIHVGAAPEGRLTMSTLSVDVSLTTGGVTRLVDRMVGGGSGGAAELPERPPQHPRRADARRAGRCWSGRSPPTSTASTATSSPISTPATVPRWPWC